MNTQPKLKLRYHIGPLMVATTLTPYGHYETLVCDRNFSENDPLSLSRRFTDYDESKSWHDYAVRRMKAYTETQ